MPTCFIAFMQLFAEGLQGVVSIDGKTLRRSFDRAANGLPLHMVTAFAVDARLVLWQLAVEAKSNEITTLPKLIELLSLKGTIVTADAMHCQRATAAAILAQEADYVLALKGNQGTLADDVARFLDDAETPVASASTTDENLHGHQVVLAGSLVFRWPITLGDLGTLTGGRRLVPFLLAVALVQARPSGRFDVSAR
jgi:hypothetical protein